MEPCNRIISITIALTAVVIAAMVKPRRYPIPTNEGNHIPKNPRLTTDIINTRITRTVFDGTASSNQIARTSLEKTNSKINKAQARAERVQARKSKLPTIGEPGFPEIEDIEKEKKELFGEEGSEGEKEYQDVSGYDEDLEESVVEETESGPDAWDEDEV